MDSELDKIYKLIDECDPPTHIICRDIETAMRLAERLEDIEKRYQEAAAKSNG